MPYLKAGDRAGDEKTFECRVHASYLGSMQSGKEFVEVCFTEKNGLGHQSKKLFLTEAGWEHAKKSLAILGWDAEANGYRFELLGDGEDSPLVGAECEIVIRAEPEQNGERIFNNVAFINAIGGGGAPREKMASDEAKKFADSIRRKLKLAVRKRDAKKNGAKEPDKEPTPIEDKDFDDIPF